MSSGHLGIHGVDGDGMGLEKDHVVFQGGNMGILNEFKTAPVNTDNAFLTHKSCHCHGMMWGWKIRKKKGSACVMLARLDK